MNYSKQTDHFDIYIDDNAKTITIRQRWKYEWRYDSPNGIKPWTDAEKKYFHNQALSLITSIWQSAPGINLKGNSDFVKNNTGKPFKFRFDIERVNSNEHWAVSANKIPNNAVFRSAVNWQTRKIVIDIQDITPSVRYIGAQAIYQIPIVHEFGHTIGNVPKISTYGDEYSIQFPYHSFRRNPDIVTIMQDYTSGMHYGSDLRARHFDYLLRELNTMIPGTTFYFNPLVRW
jgi:hypothetical protein